MKITKVLVLILFLSILVIPITLAYGTDNDLKYKIHIAGQCTLTIQNGPGDEVSPTLNVTVRSDSNHIYVKFDGRPTLPDSMHPNLQTYGYCGPYGFGFGGSNFISDLLINSGFSEVTADYCPNGALPPDPYNNNGIKCNSLCVPNKAVCIDSTTLHTCNAGDSGGTRIDSQNCALGCDGNHNVCNVAQNTLTVQTDQAVYSLGEDITVIGNFRDSSGGISGRTVIAKLTKGGAAITGELSGTTNSDGNVNFTFPKISTSGEISVSLHIDYYLGQSYDAVPKVIQVTGNSINYEVATYSQTQYSSRNITFTVKLTDLDNLIITPAQLDNLHVVATLTQGKVLGGSIEHLGDGVYRISSQVEGSGNYVGKIAFNFEGQPQSSPVVNIEVRPMSISIDVSKINPGAYLNEPANYTIKIFDATGEKLDPDNIMIEVSLPDGTTVTTITMAELTKTDTGVYTFPFTYTQVEKHTFNIYADYSNYARGTAKASVAVSSHGDDFGPGIGIGIADIQIYSGVGLGIIAVIIIGYFIIKRRKK